MGMEPAMRLPSLRFTIRRLMIVIALASAVCWAFVRYQRWSYYDTGWWEAEREIWRGHVTLYGDCGHFKGEICCVDEEMGLPVRLGGCLVPIGYDERARGHNDHVKQYIRWNGLPKNSLKPWVRELFHLARYFEERSCLGPPVRLFACGPPVTSPHKNNGVRLMTPRTPDFLRVAIFAGSNILGNLVMPSESGECDLVCGPDGSRFVVLRSFRDDKVHHMAGDLRTGEFLCSESELHPGRPPANMLPM